MEGVLSLATSTPSSRANWRSYRSDQLGFEFTYPPACEVNQQDDGLSVGARIDLVVVYDNGVALGDYVDQLVEDKTRSGDWRLESKQAVVAGENNAIRVEYRFGGVGRYGTALFLQRGGRIYIWGFTAGASICDEPDVFGDVVSSFRFAN